MHQKVLTQNSALFQTSPKLSGNVKLVLSVDSQIKPAIQTSTAKIPTLASKTSLSIQQLFETLSSSSLNYDIAQSYAKNIASFKSKLVDDSQSFWFDLAQQKEQSVELLNNKELDAYELQYYDEHQYGMKPSSIRNRFRFLAPIWLASNDASKLPTRFVIMRKRKTINGSSQVNSANTIVNEGELVMSIELVNTALFDAMKQIVTDSEFTDAPLVYSVDKTQVSGVNVDSGVYETIKTFNDTIRDMKDSTIHEDNEYLTGMFAENNLICTNLLNVEFDVEINDYDNEIELFDYFGVYATNAEVISMKTKTINDLIFNSLHTQTDILSIAKTALNDYKLSRDLMQSDTSALVVDFNIRPDEYDIVSVDVSRKIELNFQMNVAIGDYIELTVENSVITAYANSSAGQNTFVVDNDLNVTLTNMVACLEQQILLNEEFLDFEFHVIANKVIVDSNCFFDDIFLEIRVPNMVKTNVLTTSNLIEFPKSYQTINSIEIKNFNESRFKQFESLISSNRQIEVIRSDETEDGTILDASLIGEHLYVKLSTLLISEIERPTLNILTTRYAESYMCSMLSIAHFDKSFVDPLESNVYDFDNDAWVNDMIVLMQNGYGQVNVAQTTADLIAEYLTNFEIEELYLSELKNNDAESSNNPYDRLIEYDLQELAFRGKLSNTMLKWGHVSGVNSIGLPYITNRNISYGLDGGGASHETIFESYSNLDRSWFVIGTGARNYALNDAQMIQSYAGGLLTREMFTDLTTDAYENWLVHNVNVGVNGDFERVECYTSVRKRGEEHFAFFRGVEYLVNSRYAGYRFSVVLMQSANSETFFELLDNNVFKTLTLICHYAIADVTTTNLLHATNAEFSLDRMLLYRPSKLDEGVNTILTQNLFVNVTYPQQIAEKLYSGQTYYTDIIDDGGTLKYAISINDVPAFYALKDQLTIGGNLIITSTDISQNTKTITLTGIVEVHENYVWVNAVTIVDSGSVVLLDTANYTVVGDIPGALNDFNAIAVTELTYSLVHTAVANSSANRFDTLKLVNCIDKINSLEHIDVSEKDVLQKRTDVRAQLNGLSYTLETGEEQYVVNLLRYTTLSAPVIVELFAPKSRNYGGKTFENVSMGDFSSLNEFIIRKVGVEGAIKSALTQEDLPQHWSKGETILARMSYQPLLSIDSNNYRLYVDGSAFESVSASKLLLAHKSIVSSILHINKLEISRTVQLSDGRNFEINVYNIFAEYFRSNASWNAFSDNELEIFLSNLLRVYEFSYKLINSVGEELRLEIQNVDTYNQQATNDVFTVSGTIRDDVSGGVKVIVGLR